MALKKKTCPDCRKISAALSNWRIRHTNARINNPLNQKYSQQDSLLNQKYSQQDCLLPHVESITIPAAKFLIENPDFADGLIKSSISSKEFLKEA